MVGAVKAELIIVIYFNGTDNPKTLLKLDGKSAVKNVRQLLLLCHNRVSYVQSFKKNMLFPIDI